MCYLLVLPYTLTYLSIAITWNSKNLHGFDFSFCYFVLRIKLMVTTFRNSHISQCIQEGNHLPLCLWWARSWSSSSIRTITVIPSAEFYYGHGITAIESRRMTAKFKQSIDVRLVLAIKVERGEIRWIILWANYCRGIKQAVTKDMSRVKRATT
jgi:hypothetical protein